MNKLLVYVLICVFSFTASAFAAEKTINVTGMYIAGASESLNSAKQHALEDAMRLATEQAGVLVSSYSKTQNMVLTNDEVTTVASKIIKVNKKKYSVNLRSDSEIEVKAYIEAIINTDNLNEDIVNLKKENKLLKKQNYDLKNISSQKEKLKNKIWLMYRDERRKKYIGNPNIPWRNKLNAFIIRMNKNIYSSDTGSLPNIARFYYKKTHPNVDKNIVMLSIFMGEYELMAGFEPQAYGSFKSAYNLIKKHNIKDLDADLYNDLKEYCIIMSAYIKEYYPDRYGKDVNFEFE